MRQGIIRLLLMLQCYKFTLKTDSLNSWCKYSFFLFFSFFVFFFGYLFNEKNKNKKLQPTFLYSMTSQKEYSISSSGSRIYKAFF